ncbi:MAG: DUF4912 domain-containing protein [Methylacidiphilales bacterium]|nr:DUF4912 domain-containing protein [Candidatus Methylacidiphilales bacterium]MDW8349655.1 DUF4912 domain-containing protein [Verrucomicrobiae bacterium]
MKQDPKKSEGNKTTSSRRSASKLSKTTNGANGKKSADKSQVPPVSGPSPNEPVLAELDDISLEASPIEGDPNVAKFVLTQERPEFHPTPAYEYLGELPHTYGSRTLYLVARDPHWLYAYWDLSSEQFREVQQQAHDGKVFLQIYFQDGTLAQQIHIFEHVKNWYIYANAPGRSFYAEIGSYRHDGSFQAITRSGIAYAPRDTMSPNTEARFVTLPFHISFQELWQILAGRGREGEELLEILARIQEEGGELPFPYPGAIPGTGRWEGDWSAMGAVLIRHIRMGSDVIQEVTHRPRMQWAGLPTSGSWPTSPSSETYHSAFRSGPRQFFMHVNAELIIYGGTDPRARLQIEGKEITMNPDGTFRYHFTFPDGTYYIPIKATSPDGLETREAVLSFLRMSYYKGQVDATAQPPLREPIGKIPA